MVVQRLRSWPPLRGFLGLGRFFLFTCERIGKQDSFLGIHGYLYPGGAPTMASFVSGKDSIILFGQGTDRHIVFLVGFPSLCYWMCDRLVIDQLDNQTML